MTTRRTGLALALALLAAQGARGQELTEQTALNDPLAALAEALDEPGREVLAGFPGYDAGRILKGVQALERRANTPDARPDDGYVAALGYLQLLVVRRYFEREAAASMPRALRDRTDEALAARGLEHARAFAQAQPRHSDVERVIGELISFQISGPISGMSKGPEARAAIDRALTKDPGNAWAHFAIARMHFHNPAFVGGDKEAALREFRLLSRRIEDVRLSIYLARAYLWKGLPDQARYWSQVALRQAADNPEAQALARAVARTEE